MRQGTGRVDVFTFKEGLLARAAHDLHFVLEAFPVVLDGEEVRAELPMDQLRVLGPVENGVTGRYDDDQRAQVERALDVEVLRLAEHPTARFVGRAVASADGFTVEGQ